jgi:adenylate cyclase
VKELFGSYLMDTRDGAQVQNCAGCGHELRADARYCDACGASVVASVAGERKQVTVLFCDVVGSMKLAAALDPERLQEIMHDLFNRSARVVQRYQGTVDKFTGDGLMALFGAPTALEDHAIRACIAALEIQESAKELADELRRRDDIELQMRVGLNSGDVVAGEIGTGPKSYTAVGHHVGLAQRMESAAPPGGVLCSSSTARLIEGSAQLGPEEQVAIKGESALASARRLLSVNPDGSVMGRDYGPLLGRDEEMRKLLDAFGSGERSIIGVVGDPGLGKSRLIREFAIQVTQKTDLVVARCESHTADVPLWALSRMLRAMFNVARLDDPAAREEVLSRLPDYITADSDEARVLFEQLGIAENDSPALELSLDAKRRLLVDAMIKATRHRPARTLFILEDAHWIDAASDKTLAEFAATLSATESTLITSYRPEYRGALREQSETTIILGPLSDSVVVTIAAGLIGHRPSTHGIAERISNTAAGNPFFVEEIVRDLVGRGILVGSRGGYRREGDVGDIGVPATVHAVLAARIDRLKPQAKSVLNAAAVIGSRFNLDVVQALLPKADRADLANLVAVELIDQIEFVPRERYCFRHPLVRTVAYESQLTSARTRAHRRLAGAIETLDPAAADDNASLIGTHLEAAGDLQTAYGWHMRAAERLKNLDLIAARSSWQRARRIADQLPDSHDDILALRSAPRTMLTWTDWLAGCDPDADSCFDELRALTTQSGDALSLAVGMAGRMTALCTNYNRPFEAAALATDLVDMIDTLGADAAMQADLLFTVVWAQFLALDYDSALRNADRLFEIAGTVVNSSVARANAVAGISRLVTAQPERGRVELQRGIDQARGLDAVTFAAVMTLKCGLVAWGIETPEQATLADAHEAMNRAEAFGDNFSLVLGLWAYGLMLLRGDPRSAPEAIALLERARDIILKHGTASIALAPIESDLALVAAQRGEREEAIERMRAVIRIQIEDSYLTFFGVSTAAFVQLLADRGNAEDFTEATMLLALVEQNASGAGLPALEMCVQHCRMLLAKAIGDDEAHADAAAVYHDVAGRLDARGRYLVLDPAVAATGQKN